MTTTPMPPDEDPQTHPNNPGPEDPPVPMPDPEDRLLRVR